MFREVIFMKKLLFSFLVLTSATSLIAEMKSVQQMLHQAILDNSAERVREAILAGANVNLVKDGKSPLVLAVLLKKNNVVEELLNLGANPKVMYLAQKLVIHAVKLSNIEAAILLIQKGADFSGPMDMGISISSHSQNIVSYLFHRSLVAGKLELLQEIINHGFDLCGGTYSTSYWESAIGKNLNKDILDFLLKNGANPNQIILKENQVWTPLLIAVYLGKKDTAQLLLEAGADINLAGSPLWHGKQTPLSYAVQMGFSSMVEMLLEHGA